MFNGDIADEAAVTGFMKGAQLCFHCAAELSDEARMWEVNVRGTQNILRCAERVGAGYFCHLSSVGVIGRTDAKLVDELTPCNPQNPYEKSKWAAEQMVLQGIKGCQVIILRPTNVIDSKRPGILTLARRRSFIDFCKVFVKGGEYAHVVHAEDVADAALHFIDHQLETPQSYIVSCDHELPNTLSELWALHNAYRAGTPLEAARPIPHLPLCVPHFLRRIVRGGGNWGDVRYSSDKLLRTGFVFKLGLHGAIRRIASESGCPSG